MKSSEKRNVYLLFNDSFYDYEGNSKSDLVYRNFGYWNGTRDISIFESLIKDIECISDNDVNSIINNVFFKLLKNEKIVDLDCLYTIYGPSLSVYGFLLKRTNLQYEFLEKMILDDSSCLMLFSSDQIKNIDEYLFMQKRIDPTVEINKLATDGNFTNYILYKLLSIKYKNVRLVSNKRKKTEIYYKKKENNLDIEYLIKKFNLDIFNSEINVFAKNSYRLKIHNFLLNYSSKRFSDLSRAIVPSLLRLRDYNNVNSKIVDNFIFNLLPKVLESDLDQIKCISKLVAEKIKNLTLGSLHLSSIFSRFVIYYLKRYFPSKSIYLYKEHGSSFFTNKSGNFDFVENLRATTVYRKNFNSKVPPFIIKSIHTIPSSTIKFKRLFLKKRKNITFIGQPWNQDVRSSVEFKKLILTDFKINHYKYLSKNILENFDLFYLTSKKARVNQYDPLFEELKPLGVQEKINYSNSISSSQLLILTYPQTTVFDLLYLNIPFIFFLDPKDWDLNNESLTWYERFKEFGLAFRYEEYDQLSKAVMDGNIQKIFFSKEFKSFKKDFMKFIC